ncbi:copper ion binding protein [Plantibacter sp. CFBP 8798]|uniref:heavy-metal-associated domain-containing protein n=1 Tax=Plantibacter sp. CFBP 8798 TaxID=2775268 RepID=UPI0017845FDA|nr:copper ion binding protein [Plantibacter sp. CFBP 8798]MBD8467363.1 copper ion binding protein [Plantibacter sp. CFBP 8798]
MSDITTTYSVSGMTCEHCVASVTEELSEISTVHAVDVHLESGSVQVSSTAPLSEAAIRNAIEDVGYTFNGLASS